MTRGYISKGIRIIQFQNCKLYLQKAGSPIVKKYLIREKKSHGKQTIHQIQNDLIQCEFNPQNSHDGKRAFTSSSFLGDTQTNTEE